MTSKIQQAAQWIAGASHPVSFSGAGLSAESGIATFRDGSDDALWSNFDPMKLASQEGFAADPAMVTDWYNSRRKSLAQALPNAAHKTLAQQDSWVHVTQNVDNLFEAAGARPKSVLHLHGTLLSDHCNAVCGYTESVDLHNPAGLRQCPDCGSEMRPSVVWFGEALPEEVLQRAAVATEKSDLLLVVGTSAQVYPAAGLIDIARSSGSNIIVVNTESTGMMSGSEIEIIGKAGEVIPQLFD